MRAQNIAREIIFAVGDNMREGLEPLLTKTLAPSLYQVYLHPDDFDRVRTILPQIEEETKEHLNRQLEAMSRGSVPALDRVRDRLPLGATKPAKEPTMKFVPAAGDWSIRFQEDPNDQLDPGEIEVISELAVAPPTSYGAGSKTQRISVSTTRKLGVSESARRSQEIGRDGSESSDGSELPTAPVAAALPWAYISFRDENGPQRFAVTVDELVIGRGAASPAEEAVGLQLSTKPDVSRRHARVRRQPSTGGFWIEDLSQFGTAVNGRQLPQGVEVELPDVASISLASVITLEFEKTAS